MSYLKNTEEERLVSVAGNSIRVLDLFLSFLVVAVRHRPKYKYCKLYH